MQVKAGQLCWVASTPPKMWNRTTWEYVDVDLKVGEVVMLLKKATLQCKEFKWEPLLNYTVICSLGVIEVAGRCLELI
jgi:hypothetical protein